VTHFGGSIDEFEFNFFKSSSGLSDHHGFSEDNNSFFATNNSAFDHDELMVDNTVMWETTHWGNVFVS
jgi:hypothetical protein